MNNPDGHFVRLGNLLRDLPSAEGESFETFVSGPHVRIERIVSRGQSSPPDFWYDQSENEYVLVLAGSAALEVEGRPPIVLAAGDWIDIPAHVRHRVAWTAQGEPTVWLAVFRPELEVAG